jgi:hypothetical protein
MKKRLFLTAGLALIAAALTQCSYRESETLLPAEAGEQPFELFAAASDTRTSAEGLSTRWVAGDAFGVFHASAGTGAFISDGSFTVDDASTGHATGTVHPLSDGSYDWYIQYPFSESPSPEAVAVLLGSEAGKAQQQAGYGSTAHLAGEAFPLFGIAEGVDYQSVPTVAVQPVAAAVAITVTNTLDEPVTLTGVTLRAPEAVVGLFQADLADTPALFTAEDATLVSAEASLEVTGGTALAKGASAVLYLGLKPFTAAAGSTLTLSVTATNAAGISAIHEKTVTLSRETAFRSGYIRKLSSGFAGTFVQPEPGEYIFMRVSYLTPDKRYLIVVQDGDGYRMAVSRKESGNTLATTPVTVEDDMIKLTSLEDAFSFMQAVQSNGTVLEGAYAIRQEDGQYVGVSTTSTSANLAFSASASSNSYWWKPATEENPVLVARAKTFCYRADKQDFAAPASASATGVYPVFFRLLNEEESTEALLGKTEYGAYGLPDWLYEAGTMQLSMSRGTSSVSFRILQPTDKIITEMSGIPRTLSVDDSFTLHVLRLEKGRVRLDKDFLVRVLKTDREKAWLLSPTGAGFIVMFQ